MVKNNVCATFINRPPNSYRPLACRPLVITTREITGTGRENKQQLYFITKPNTIRERATLDLLYPTPSWLANAVKPEAKQQFERITTVGDTRVIDIGLIRVTA